MTLSLEIPILPKTPNSIGKSSIWHSVNERKKWRQILGRMESSSSFPMAKAKLTLTRCSSREPDLDNLYASFKFVIDGLKFNGVIEDDKPSSIDLKCLWKKAKQKEGGIIIQIEELK